MSIFKNLITSNLSRGVTRHSIRPLSLWSTTPPFTTPVINPRIPMREAITTPIPTTFADHRFLADVATYTWKLRNRYHRGVPDNWGEAQACFNMYHRDDIVKIQFWNPYTINTVITEMEFMQLYVRCTFEDIQKVFMYLRSKNIGVAVGKYSGHPRHSPSTDFIRLSGLNVSNTPCITLRTDASLLGDLGGYGYIFSDSGDNYLDWCYGSKDYIAPAPGLTLTERVTVLELYAILKALESPIFIEEAQTNPKLRILTDCYNAVQIMQGKPVVANMVAGVTYKYYSYVMDLMCSIGYEIKPLYDYSCNHIYRELNGDCDFLANMGRIHIHPTFQEVYNRRESERVRLYYLSPPYGPPTSSTVPSTSSPRPGPGLTI